MNVLVLGNGGREHALCMKIKESPHCDKLFVAPGNGGTEAIAENVPINPLDFESVKRICLQEKIDFVVPGGEDTLVAGISDFFASDTQLSHISVAGPPKRAARLEGSKNFAKDFLVRHQIPTARYRTITLESLDEGCLWLDTLQPPYVLKADGLAAGKGVLIIEDLKEAKTELRNMLVENKFGDAGTKVVVEEYLSGIELSCFVMTDGNNYLILPEAKDYKRIGEGDTGLNTGGMGAVSPVPFAGKEFLKRVEERIVKPTLKGIKKDNLGFRGVVFIGLMNVKGEPYVIEYNVRFGDPEAETILPRIESDFLLLLKSCCDGTINQYQLKIKSKCSATVILASKGYPSAIQKGKPISGTETVTDSLVFHSGTAFDSNNQLVTNGGRVIAVTSLADSLIEAVAISNKNAGQIEFDGKYYRRDIGQDLFGKATHENNE